MSVPYSFPFFGVGDAAYFEWAEVQVLFAREPSADERAAIEARVPPPLEPSWKGGRRLQVGSDQFVHIHIAEHYPADQGDDDFDEGSSWFFAASSRVRRFNEDIDAWLAVAHQHCPVLVAHRAQDAEAGGTQLPAWHTWSVQQLPGLLPALEPVAAACADPDGEDFGVAHLLRGVVAAAAGSEVELPAYLHRWAR
ncbi:hypothetical protein AADR41_22815 [Streptomyces sp. CLV115]|uniref:hypothetical protein n=1 Tax=Streptomyces sp. CLV115 TaxID=3138502 RepID=UPI00313AEC6A